MWHNKNYREWGQSDMGQGRSKLVEVGPNYIII